MRKLILLVGTFLALHSFAPPSVQASNKQPIPAGYTVVEQDTLGPGLTHYALTRSTPPLRLHVARLEASSPLSIRSVLSNEAIAEPGERLEKPSAMCVRISCLVSVNADFFAYGQPVGALVSNGILERSTNSRHHQLTIDATGQPSTEGFTWKSSLVSTDLEALNFDAINREREANQLVLYTPDFGPSTATNEFGVEVAVTVVEPKGPLAIGRTAIVLLGEVRENIGNTPIPEGGAVLSGHGKAADALLRLAARIASEDASSTALLRVETTPKIAESVGGTPILVRNGRRWFADLGTPLYRYRHPRTMIGWSRDGDIMLVTVDGRRPGTSVGATMAEAADIMLELGAVEAINLDGGGSTSFVVNGRLTNLPSDAAVRRGGDVVVVHAPRKEETVLANVERPVAVALAIVDPSRAAKTPAPTSPISLENSVIPALGQAETPDALGAGLTAGLTPGEPFSDGLGLALAFIAAAIVLRRRLFSFS